ncbi:MAG: ABC transporter ATP-binding protein [Deltaproteobacteria bacterium]|nr:ABC transporter ATP-binding protein [Deltaproteobacteria bacterium]
MEFIDDLKIIWRFLSKYKRQVYAIFVVAVLASMIEATIPYIYGKIVDLIIADEVMSVIFGILFLWLILSFVKDWGKRYTRIYGMGVGIRCMHDFVLLLSGHSLKLKPQYHKKQKSGKLASRYIKASDALENLLFEIIAFVPNMLMILFVLIFMAIFIHWLLFVVIAINLLIYLFITLKYSKSITDPIIKTQKSNEDAFGFSHDSVSNIQLVKANSREEYENKKVLEVFKNRTQKHFKRFLSVLNRLSFFQDASLAIGIFVLLIIVMIMFKNSAITVGQVVTVVGYLGLISIPMKELGLHINRYRRWIGVIRHGYELLDEEIEPYNKKGAVKLREVRGDIEFKKINFRYH